MAQAISRGASGAAVKKIQKMLNKSGAPKRKLEEDGEFDTKTEAAVKTFQKDNRLKVDGLVDGALLQAIMIATQKLNTAEVKDVKGVKRRKLSDKQRQKADALKGKTTDTKAMRDNADRLEQHLDEFESNLDEWEEELATAGDDAQLANVDMQSLLQKQQQMLQMISNVSKMMHDTSMSIIRKIG